MNKKEILSEANKLVSNGLRKAAIELLLEYLESDPNSSTVLGALGRVYLLDNQPEKAVTYLKKSLEIKQGVGTSDNIPSGYRAENFSDDDLAYVDSQTEKLFEEVFCLEADEPIQSTGINKIEVLSNEKTFISTNSTQVVTIQPSNIKNSVQTILRGRIKLTQTNNGVSPIAIAPPAEEISTQVDQADKCDSPECIQQEQMPASDNISSVQINLRDSIPDEIPGKQFGIDDVLNTEFEDDDDSDFSDNEEILTDELLLDEDDEDVGLDLDTNEEELDELLAPSSPYALEEESEEVIWDDFEDLDEFDELAHREVEEEVQGDGKISREYRARQIAIEVLDKSDWDQMHLPLLQKVFYENGWSAARIAIEKEISRGLLPEQLALARKIRGFWSGNEQFWISFSRIKTNVKFKQSDATYKHMSWLESLRIIRCFQSLPDIDEIYSFIDEEYDHWYNSDNLRRNFKVFFKYLKYRTGSMHRTLSGDCVFSFYEPNGADIGVDSDMFYSPNTYERQKLLDVGVELNQWPPQPKNMMKVIKEFLE